MAEYISREAAIEKLNRLCDRVCQYSKAQRKYMCGACPLGDAFTVIEGDIPAADVRPVVHGTWKQFQEPDDGGPLSEWLSQFPSFECSECGYKFLKIYDAPKNFCPNCGADMRGESDV